MVNLQGPLQSLVASGKLGQALQFDARRRGVVAGRRRRPRQPRTEAQRATRLFMAWLAKEWALRSPAELATWAGALTGPRDSAYTSFIRYNINRFKNLPGTTAFPDVLDNFPSTAYPATRNTNNGTIGFEIAYPGKNLIHHIVWPSTAEDAWFHAYHRITTDHPQPVYANLVHIQTVDGTYYYDIIIPNLPAGPTTLRWSRSSHTAKADHTYKTITETVTD